MSTSVKLQFIRLVDRIPAMMPRGVDLEIYEEADPQQVAEMNRIGVIRPNAVRINGMDVLGPDDRPMFINRIDPGPTAAGGFAMVTLTLFARSVVIAAKPKLDLRDGPIYEQLVAELGSPARVVA